VYGPELLCEVSPSHDLSNDIIERTFLSTSVSLRTSTAPSTHLPSAATRSLQCPEDSCEGEATADG
jgi:hypothetical protein